MANMVIGELGPSGKKIIDVRGPSVLFEDGSYDGQGAFASRRADAQVELLLKELAAAEKPRARELVAALRRLNLFLTSYGVSPSPKGD